MQVKDKSLYLSLKDILKSAGLAAALFLAELSPRPPGFCLPTVPVSLGFSLSPWVFMLF